MQLSHNQGISKDDCNLIEKSNKTSVQSNLIFYRFSYSRSAKTNYTFYNKYAWINVFVHREKLLLSPASHCQLRQKSLLCNSYNKNHKIGILMITGIAAILKNIHKSCNDLSSHAFFCLDFFLSFCQFICPILFWLNKLNGNK